MSGEIMSASIIITVNDWIANPYVATKVEHKKKAMRRLNLLESFILEKGLKKEFEEWCVRYE